MTLFRGRRATRGGPFAAMLRCCIRHLEVSRDEADEEQHKQIVNVSQHLLDGGSGSCLKPQSWWWPYVSHICKQEKVVVVGRKQQIESKKNVMSVK